MSSTKQEKPLQVNPPMFALIATTVPVVTEQAFFLTLKTESGSITASDAMKLLITFICSHFITTFTPAPTSKKFVDWLATSSIFISNQITNQKKSKSWWFRVHETFCGSGGKLNGVFNFQFVRFLRYSVYFHH